MKKVLSLVLVLALVLGSFSFAFAFDDTADLDCEDAVDTLVALGVINGFNDGTFRPGDTVTRAQIAKMLVVSLGYEDLITGASSSFSDTVGHWADAYIAFAAGQGIVNGYPDGTFRPDATVSYDEAITMIVRALGYTDDVLNGSWPTNYKIKAVDLDITDDVKITAGGADRGGVAHLLYNALECKMVYIDNEGVEHFVLDGDFILLQRLGIKGYVYVSPETLDEDEDAYVESKIDLEPYMYETLEVYKAENEDGDKEVVYVSKVKTANLEGDVVTSAAVGSDMYIEEADEDIKDFKTSANLYFNGAKAVTTTTSTITDAAVKAVFAAKENDSPDTTSPMGIVATLETDAKRISKEYKDEDLKIDGIKLPVTTNDDDDEIVDLNKLVIEGDATSLEDIKEDDVVEVYAADNKTGKTYPQKVRLVVTRNTLEGKVTKYKDNDEIYVDGVKYKTSSKNLIGKDKLGNEYTYFLDQDGKILDFEIISEELSNYAVVVGMKDGDLTDDFGNYDIDHLAQLKLAKADGETVVYDVYSDYDEGTTVVAIDFDSFKLKGTTDQAVVVTDGALAITFDEAITEGALVKYDTNSDGQIDELEIVTYTEEGVVVAVSGNNLGDKYTVGSKTVIFNGTDNKYKVIDIDEIAKNATISAVVDEDSSFGTLEVCVVTAGVKTSQGENYAVIISKYSVLNSDDEDVFELTMLLNGEEETYITENDSSSLGDVDATTDALVELEINSSDEVTKSTVVTNATANCAVYGTVGTSTVQAIDADDSLIRFDSKNYEIADDVVVYVCNYDKEDGWDDTIVGDLDDIEEEDYVKAYDLDADEEDGVEVIFIYTGDLTGYSW